MQVEVEVDSSVYLDVYKPVVGSDADIIFFWGGRDSGKTQHIAQELIVKCLEEDYFRGILVKKTAESIKDSQWQTIKDVVEDWGLSELFTFKIQPLEIHCVNGNKFIARGCDKPEKVKSIRNPTDVWYEEMDQLTEADHITIQTTLRTDRGKIKEWGSFNPECVGDFHEFWIYKNWVGERYEHFKETRSVSVGDSEVDMVVEGIHTTYSDNKYVTPERKARHESLAATSPYYYRVFTKGLWGKKEVLRPFAISFDRNKHVGERAVFQPNRIIYISFDFNLDPFGFIFQHKWADDQGYHCHTFDEGKIKNASLEEGLDWIRVKYGRYAHNFVITGDKMGDRRDFGQLDRASFYTRMQRFFGLRPIQIETHANPKHKDSRDDVNYVLFHFDDFLIHPKLTDSISDFENVEIDAYGSIIKTNRKNENQRADHLDCHRYSINDRYMQAWLKQHQLKNR